MTTQELKQQIDKVLGNSIRCLLPSYWWKRLFNQVADRVDEVEQSTSQLIDSKVEEVKMPIVDSVDELSKLDLPKGRVAAVEKTGEPVVVNLEDCFLPLDSSDWDKCTIVRGVEKKDNIGADADGGLYFVALVDGGDVEHVLLDDTIVVGAGDGLALFGKITHGLIRWISLQEANEYLASGKYRYFYSYNRNSVLPCFTFYSAIPQPSLYIKGETWERLAKECVVSSEEELNALSVENGTIATATREAEKFIGVSTLLQYEDGVDYNSLFKVKKVSISVPKTSIGELSLVYLSTREGNVTLTIVCSADGKDGYIQAWYEDGRKVDLMREQTLVQSNIDDLNSYLSKNVVRYISAGASSGSHFEFIDTWFKVATPYTVADAYIKGETWTRFLKEGDVVGGGPEILELTFGETEEDRANNVKIYNKIVEAFNSDDINIPMISVGGMLVSNVTLSGIEGDLKAHMNLVSDYVAFKYLITLNLAKTGEVTFEEELEFRDYYHIRASSDMVEFAKCVAAGLLPNVLYADSRQGLVIADTFNNEGDNIVLYFNLSKGRIKVVVSSETGEILSEEVVSSGADITIDSELSDTSENPVQNKAVKAYIDNAITNTLNTEV